MEDIDIEEQAPFPVDRDGKRLGAGEERRKAGCCEKLHQSISRWLLPSDIRETYLERANCCPPPIFIILISIGEVGATTHGSDGIRRGGGGGGRFC